MRVRGSARERRAKRPVESGDKNESESTVSLALGDWDSLRPRLPLVVDFEGHQFRIIELGEKPVAYSAECPHWLGPLGDCSVEKGVVTCPWHGYRFDAATGRSADDRGLRLRSAECDRDQLQRLVRVLGDNPVSSADSRQIGWIPLERIVGRVAFLYWPPVRAGLPSERTGSTATD